MKKIIFLIFFETHLIGQILPTIPRNVFRISLGSKVEDSQWDLNNNLFSLDGIGRRYFDYGTHSSSLRFSSNHDLYQMIPFHEKEKVRFFNVSQYSDLASQKEGFFDIAFIDGDHTNEKVILNDYMISKHLLREDGVFLFDDYHPEKFSVKSVVDQILESDSSLEAELVCFHGHLFDKERSVTDNGIVIVKKKGTHPGL